MESFFFWRQQQQRNPTLGINRGMSRQRKP
jgi:hypothetical protein